jgi:hypothetical protein
MHPAEVLALALERHDTAPPTTPDRCYLEPAASLSARQAALAVGASAFAGLLIWSLRRARS